MKKYMVNEIFWSPQGEGMRAGEMSVFVRFTGCNLECSIEAGPKSPGGFDCDTEFASGRKMTGKDIINECFEVTGQKTIDGLWIVFTGGEPALQLDRDLVTMCQAAGFKCAIETNGSICGNGRGLDWITVSPKVAEHAIRQDVADEVKYVRGYGQGIPKPTCQAKHQLISPATIGNTFDPRAIDWCLELIKENPKWRLSCQLHKMWLVR